MMRWPWLIFAVLLVCGIVAFSFSADWSSQSWLDLAAYAVSLPSILGVCLYAFGHAHSGAVFWRAFRWLFIGVVTVQTLFHAIEVAGQHKYSATGTLGFVSMVAIVIGWIYVLQWIAITRLAKAQGA